MFAEQSRATVEKAYRDSQAELTKSRQEYTELKRQMQQLSHSLIAKDNCLDSYWKCIHIVCEEMSCKYPDSNVKVGEAVKEREALRGQMYVIEQSLNDANAQIHNLDSLLRDNEDGFKKEKEAFQSKLAIAQRQNEEIKWAGAGNENKLAKAYNQITSLEQYISEHKCDEGHRGDNGACVP